MEITSTHLERMKYEKYNTNLISTCTVVLSEHSSKEVEDIAMIILEAIFVYIIKHDINVS